MSAAFVNSEAEQVDEQLEQGLARVCQLIGVDRGSIFAFDTTRKQLQRRINWAAPGRSASPPTFAATDFSWVAEQSRHARVISFTNPAEIPDEGAADRRLFEKLGIRSFLTLPLWVGGEPVGSLSFLTLDHEIHWPDALLQRLQVVSEVFANAIARQRDRRQREQRFEFEQLLVELSTNLIKARSDELHARLAESLAAISSFLGVERSTVAIARRGSATLDRIHTWHAEGVAPSAPTLTVDPQSWIRRQTAAGITVSFSRPSALPEECGSSRQEAEDAGVRSAALIPMVVGSSTIGTMSYFTHTKTVRWPEDVLQRLRLVAEIVTNALVRDRQETRLTRRLHFEELLLGLSSDLLQLPAEGLAAEIEKWLALLADYVGVERVGYSEFSPDGETLKVRSCHARDGAPDGTGIQQSERSKPYAEMLRRGEVVRIENLPSGFPTDAHETIEVPESVIEEAEAMRAHLAIPIPVDAKHLGVLSFSSFSRPRRWSDELINRLTLAGRLFASTLARRDSEAELETAYGEIRKLNERLEAENVYLREELSPRTAEGIVGQSAVLRRVLRQVERVAATDTTVLLTGETGTGKELIADAIHSMSPRSPRTMIRVNCAALPSTLIESELFGRERGAFTGASSRQIGRFEAADGSTIFLDEIGELPLETQAKLLRVLEEGRFERLGSVRSLEVDARIVAATNRDLAAEVAAGRFRQDLYYRLEVFPVEVPPLRERREDIPLLAWAFARDYAERLGKTIESVSRPHMEALQAYPWPGNVRELRNVIERAVILADGPNLEITLPDRGGQRTSNGQSLEDVQRDHILVVLDRTEWRIRGRNGAAEQLGLKPTTLEYRMKRLGIERPKAGTKTH
jgi:transcriptional regulator with GAF, ATPase, and Fis domain